MERYGQSSICWSAGEHQRELIAYFGADEYPRSSHSRAKRSQMPLSRMRRGCTSSRASWVRNWGACGREPLPNDVLWLDPVDISLGQLALLRLPVDGVPAVSAEEHKHAPLQDEPQSPEETRIVSLGVVLYTYLRLKLHLRIAGFAPVFHDYDWRLGVDELGRGLAKRIRDGDGRES